MRYERKYRVEDVSAAEVREVVRTLPGSFHQPFPDRWVNSIYLDSPEFLALRENLGGISNRIKYRIRWYGALRQLIEKPVLEKKIKQNMLGEKEHLALPPLDLTRQAHFTAYLQRHTDLPFALRPVVLIRYLRTYLARPDGKIRATIDRHLQYYHFAGDLPRWQQPAQDEAIILEVKYAPEEEEKIDDLLQAIPFRLTKNSKFVSGTLSWW